MRHGAFGGKNLRISTDVGQEKASKGAGERLENSTREKQRNNCRQRN